jgi:putative nucleotidyltransferase with HDIG domain
LWDEYKLPEHIREHSRQVADVAGQLADLAHQQGLPVDKQLLRAAALLHDLGKAYALRYEGDHCQLGAAWVMDLTGNPALAQAVMHHVSWPGAIDPDRHPIPIILVYCDKRVKHDRIVSLEERYRDLLERYGLDAPSRAAIEQSQAEVKAIEKALSERLKVDLHAYPFARRRLVR